MNWNGCTDTIDFAALDGWATFRPIWSYAATCFAGGRWYRSTTGARVGSATKAHGSTGWGGRRGSTIGKGMQYTQRSSVSWIPLWVCPDAFPWSIGRESRAVAVTYRAQATESARQTPESARITVCSAVECRCGGATDSLTGSRANQRRIGRASFHLPSDVSNCHTAPDDFSFAVTVAPDTKNSKESALPGNMAPRPKHSVRWVA